MGFSGRHLCRAFRRESLWFTLGDSLGGGTHKACSQAAKQAARQGGQAAARQPGNTLQQPGSQAIRQLTASSAYIISLISIPGALAWIIELMNFLRNFNC